MSSLKAKAVNSLKWTTLFSLYMTLSNSLGLVIKSRFLSPEQFGGLSILMLFIGFFQIFSDMGISQAIIKEKQVNKEQISTLFYFNIIVSIVASVLLFACSDFLATLFEYPSISELLKLSSLIILIKGPSIQLKAILEKELRFKEITYIDVITDLILQISTFLFLIKGYGLVSIVYGYILSTTIATILYWFYVLTKNQLKIAFIFKPKLLAPFMQFGVYVTGQSILSYVSSRIDVVVIGIILSPEVLGVYYFGKNLLERLHQVVTTSFKKVLFPTFSKLADNKNLLAQTYYKLCEYLSFIAFPVFTGTALTAHLFVPLIFGEQWNSSVIVVQVFSLFLIIKLITDKLTISLLYAKDKPKYIFFTNLITTCAYMISLIIFKQLELIGVLIAYSLFTLYRSITLEHLASKILDGSFRKFISIFKTAFLCTLFMSIIAIVFLTITKNVNNQVLLLSGVIIISAASYFFLIKFFAKETMNGLVIIIKGGISSRK